MIKIEHVRYVGIIRSCDTVQEMAHCTFSQRIALREVGVQQCCGVLCHQHQSQKQQLLAAMQARCEICFPLERAPLRLVP